MDILVTFPDGTTERRAANSYAHWADARRLAKYKQIGEREIGEVSQNSYFTIASKRGIRDATVWRITGRDAATKALTGEWQSCRVETADEQIERLTRERDAAANALRMYRDAGDYEKVMTFPERGRILGEARRMSAEALVMIDGKDG